MQVLSAKALEQALVEIRALVDEGQPIAVKPTRIWVPREPWETDKQYRARVGRIKRRLQQLKGPK